MFHNWEVVNQVGVQCLFSSKQSALHQLVLIWPEHHLPHVWESHTRFVANCKFDLVFSFSKRLTSWFVERTTSAGLFRQVFSPKLRSSASPSETLWESWEIPMWPERANADIKCSQLHLVLYPHILNSKIHPEMSSVCFVLQAGPFWEKIHKTDQIHWLQLHKRARLL